VSERNSTGEVPNALWIERFTRHSIEIEATFNGYDPTSIGNETVSFYTHLIRHSQLAIFIGGACGYLPVQVNAFCAAAGLVDGVPITDISDFRISNCVAVAVMVNDGLTVLEDRTSECRRRTDDPAHKPCNPDQERSTKSLFPFRFCV